jgi:hypothetical protein
MMYLLFGEFPVGQAPGAHIDDLPVGDGNDEIGPAAPSQFTVGSAGPGWVVGVRMPDAYYPEAGCDGGIVGGEVIFGIELVTVVVAGKVMSRLLVLHNPLLAVPLEPEQEAAALARVAPGSQGFHFSAKLLG